ncbi:AraC family transcriptional regulator [Aliifodinibius sp. S!AR15-10]|uniref:helix-turn-helix domain-containing protein n=1 Tax=Aliifodinibius sp. S!AR15-10 TaxID=2950437 RepID=UPI0028596683|nr:AraC family transcriptional regulator [Aliifodinibius sp. S!AR15-10]MDR8393835.1 AraC family transcriptional regulator [Aliifodinibius sp. S!AR15-10]
MGKNINSLESLVQDYRNELPEPAPEWPSEVREMMLFLNEHLFDKNLSIKKAKSNCYSNGNNISTLFKHYVGESPKEYVIKHRLEAGKRLLTNRHLSGVTIFVVSICLGYSGSGAFSHMFKKKTGMPPSEWREKKLAEVAE